MSLSLPLLPIYAISCLPFGTLHPAWHPGTHGTPSPPSLSFLLVCLTCKISFIRSKPTCHILPLIANTILTLPLVVTCNLPLHWNCPLLPLPPLICLFNHTFPLHMTNHILIAHLPKQQPSLSTKSILPTLLHRRLHIGWQIGFPTGRPY